MSFPRLLGIGLLALWAFLFFASRDDATPLTRPDSFPTDGVKRRPLLPWRGDLERFGSVGAAQVGGTTSPDGAEQIHVDLDKRFHLTNRGGSDGAGLCVFASLKHSSIWQHVYETQMIFEWMFTKPGGGYPSKVDKVISSICKEKSVPVPPYIQVESRDLEILKIACKSGRMPGVTYYYSPTKRYGGQKISHMVSLVHASDKWFGILDNNYPGSIEWMDPQTFLSVYSGGKNGWAVVFLNDGPPPPPRNKK